MRAIFHWDVCGSRFLSRLRPLSLCGVNFLNVDPVEQGFDSWIAAHYTALHRLQRLPPPEVDEQLFAPSLSLHPLLQCPWAKCMHAWSLCCSRNTDVWMHLTVWMWDSVLLQYNRNVWIFMMPVPSKSTRGNFSAGTESLVGPRVHSVRD